VAALPAWCRQQAPKEPLLLLLPPLRPLRPPQLPPLLPPRLLVGMLLLLVVIEQHLTAEHLDCYLSAPGDRRASHREKSSGEGEQRAGCAHGTAPRGLYGSDAMIGCFSRQPEALTGHPQRVHPARLAAETVPKALTSRRWPAVMTPRNGGLRAADAVASHRAADGAGPSIEGARACAHATSRGAAAAVSRVRSAIGTEAELDEPLTSPTKRPRAAPGGFLLAQWYAMLQV
jgi:hypothetical protein